jgi:NAD-dependent deacetylase
MNARPNKIDRLKELIDKSRRSVVFTGAGISTESGIPDFRSPGGIWTKYKPIDFREFMASAEMRKESWRRKFAADPVMKAAQPNKGHFAVAKWVAAGKVASVITQNVDGLHQRAGVPDEKVIELHGNATYAACLDCKKRYELESIQHIFAQEETLPVCDECTGIIKTATISFGQAMPVDEVQAAEEETLVCDLFLAIGSSLVVYPAAGFPALAKRNGAKLVIINRDPTSLDSIADLVLNCEIGTALSAAAELD